MIFLSLKKGKITLKPDGEPETAFSYPKHGKRPTEDVIGEFLAERPGWDFLTSSSINHPGEYGFSPNFHVERIMSRAVERAYRKLAISVEPGPLDKAVETLEALQKAHARKFPLALRFRRSSRKGEDALLVFKTYEDLDHFISGLQYGRNLTAMSLPV